MQLPLKKVSIGILFLFTAITSCKKDGKAPVVNAISGGKEKIAVGQYMELNPEVSDGDTKEEKLTYIWNGTDGTSSKGRILKWRPLKSGNQSLTLTVSDGDKLTEKNISFNVQAPDFRLGLWGNTSAEIQLYEVKANKTLQGKSSTILAYEGEVPGITDAYALTNGSLSQGMTLHTNVYANSTQYVTDYYKISNKLITKYGSYLTSKIYFRTQELQTMLTGHPELWADAIVAGDAVLESIWEKDKNKITLLLGRSSTSETIILAEYYAPKSTVTTTSSFENNDVRKAIEKLILQIKP